MTIDLKTMRQAIDLIIEQRLVCTTSFAFSLHEGYSYHFGVQPYKRPVHHTAWPAPFYANDNEF